MTTKKIKKYHEFHHCLLDENLHPGLRTELFDGDKSNKNGILN